MAGAWVDDGQATAIAARWSRSPPVGPPRLVTVIRVLVVDDEPELREMVRRYLEAEDFAVTEAGDGDAALELMQTAVPDLIILDVTMPGRDGFEVLQELRRTSKVPVIMLTARTEEIDRVVGLTVGADDYITKPFSPRELVARIRAVLRRSQPDPDDTDETPLMRFEGLCIDRDGREIRRSDEPVELSALEFELLVALAGSPGRVFSRAQLLEKVWGWDYYGVDRVVDVHIGNIRKQLSDDADDPQFIATVRGVGYKFIAIPS